MHVHQRILKVGHCPIYFSCALHFHLSMGKFGLLTTNYFLHFTSISFHRFHYILKHKLSIANRTLFLLVHTDIYASLHPFSFWHRVKETGSRFHNHQPGHRLPFVYITMYKKDRITDLQTDCCLWLRGCYYNEVFYNNYCGRIVCLLFRITFNLMYII